MCIRDSPPPLRDDSVFEAAVVHKPGGRIIIIIILIIMLNMNIITSKHFKIREDVCNLLLFVPITFCTIYFARSEALKLLFTCKKYILLVLFVYISYLIYSACIFEFSNKLKYKKPQHPHLMFPQNVPYSVRKILELSLIHIFSMSS